MAIIRPGLLDLVQDLGRPGYRHLGVPEGGAADQEALILANRLVGNEDGAAGLEFTLQGPEILFPDGAVVALAGARFDVNRSGRPVNWNETLVLRPGEKLDLGKALDCCRGYLAVEGGIRLEPVLGSRATFLPGAFGGQKGRQLKAGDELPVGKGQSVHTGRFSVVEVAGPIRVVAGPQLGNFSEVALLNLFSGGFFVVDSCSNRTGIRLMGLELKTLGLGSLPSQGVLPGAIQVPPDGQPIILGWDGPVTGGYPVIAGVIAADLGRVAQLKPNDRVSFVALSPEEARQAWADRQKSFDRGITWLD